MSPHYISYYFVFESKNHMIHKVRIWHHVYSHKYTFSDRVAEHGNCSSKISDSMECTCFTKHEIHSRSSDFYVPMHRSVVKNKIKTKQKMC